METREITIVSTKTQKRSVIMSSAETLGELKADLRRNDIDYEDMAFYEGLSRIEVKDDSSILPHDVPYKGQITNKLVFMLTNNKKKIKSGSMSRAEAYDHIRKMGLQEEVFKKFGKNFTVCKTVDLVNLVESKFNQTPVPTTLHVEEEVAQTAQVDAPTNKGCCCNDAVKQAIFKLVDILFDNDVISDDEADSVIKILDTTDNHPDSQKQSGTYSNDEIDKMFNFIH